MRPAMFRIAFTRFTTIVLCTGVLGFGSTAAVAQGAEAAWDTLAGPIDPTPSLFPQILHDPIRHQMIVLDGLNPGEIWTRTLTGTESLRWNRILIDGPLPVPRIRFAAAYDSLRDRILMFGGGWSAPFNDVWALSLEDRSWSQLSPAGTPPPAGGPYTAVFDPARDRLIVIGALPGLWELDFAGAPTWNVMTPAGEPPSHRGGASAVLDPWNDRIVFFGGYEDVPEQPCHGILYDETWALSLSGTSSWSRISTPTNPPARVLQTAVVDLANRTMVIHGGRPYSNCTPPRPREDTWALSLVGAAEWIPLATSRNPPAAEDQTTMYSPERGSLIRYQGTWDTCFELDLSTRAWSQLGSPGPVPHPVPRPAACLIADPASNQLLMFGGICRHDLWTFGLGNSSGWNPLSTVGVAPNCGWPGFVFDTRRNRLLSFAAVISPVPDARGFRVAEMSLGSPRAWNELAIPGDAPPSNSDFSVIYDPVRDRVLLFGGTYYISLAYDCGVDEDELWSLSLGDTMRWTRLTPKGTPGPRDGHTAVYDPLHDRMLVLGGGLQNQHASLGCNRVKLHDTWALSLRADSLQWTLLSERTPDSQTPAVVDSLRERILLLGSDLTPWEYALDGSAEWRALPVTGNAPGPRSAPALVMDSSRDRLLMFGGDQHADLYSLRFLVPPTRTVSVSMGPGESVSSRTGGSHGVGLVVIHGEASFSADSIVATSISVAGAPARSKANGATWTQFRDENGDGYRDLVLQIDRESMQLGVNDSVAVVRGRTTHGTRLVGTARMREPKPGRAREAVPSVSPADLVPGVRALNSVTRGSLAIQYQAWSSAPARVELLDVRGRRVYGRDLALGESHGGRMDLDGVQTLPSGMYFVRIVQGEQSARTRVILLH